MEIVKIESTTIPDQFVQVASYVVGNIAFDCIDISQSSDPVLAVADNHSLQLFPVNTSDPSVQPISTVRLAQTYKFRWRQRAARFLSDSSLALATGFVEGPQRAPISIYDISPSGLSSTPLVSYQSISPDTATGRHCAKVLTPLATGSTTSNAGGQVFLSGWTDGVVRVHDVREPSLNQAYMDPVDDGQILSLVAIGHERFLAGSHQNACLKVFDLRMSGGRVYDSINVRQRMKSRGNANVKPVFPEAASDFGLQGHTRLSELARGLTIFLSVPFPQPRNRRPSVPLPASTSLSGHGTRPGVGGRPSPIPQLGRYRGSIYSLSVPTPYSPTVYVGIESYVISLDWHSTDDILCNTESVGQPPSPTPSKKATTSDHSSRLGPSHANIASGTPLDASANPARQTAASGLANNGADNATRFGSLLPTPGEISSGPILELSSYLRPRPGRESTDALLLRNQMSWSETVRRWESKPIPSSDVRNMTAQTNIPTHTRGPTEYTNVSASSRPPEPHGLSQPLEQAKADGTTRSSDVMSVERDKTPEEEGWDLRWRLARYERREHNVAATRQWGQCQRPRQRQRSHDN